MVVVREDAELLAAVADGDRLALREHWWPIAAFARGAAACSSRDPLR